MYNLNNVVQNVLLPTIAIIFFLKAENYSHTKVIHRYKSITNVTNITEKNYKGCHINFSAKFSQVFRADF